MFLYVGAPQAPPAGKGGILTRNADVQHLLGAHQNQILRRIGHAVEAQAVAFFEEQRGRRARDAPARMPHASDDAVEVVGDEDGDRRERLVHLDPQDVIDHVGTTL